METTRYTVQHNGRTYLIVNGPAGLCMFVRIGSCWSGAIDSETTRALMARVTV